MKIIATLLKVETGEIREYLYYQEMSEETAAYVWRDGNYSCDCNREIFFERAIGEGTLDDIECSEGRFELLKLTIDSREIKEALENYGELKE